MTILLVAEHSNDAVNDATHKAMTAAAAMGGDVHVLVAGKGARAAAEQAAKIAGAAKVLLADGDGLAQQLAEPMSELIVSLAEGYDAIVAPATANGKNILPRVAALLDVMQLSDVTGVIDGSTFERPIYAGNAIQTVKSNGGQEGHHRADRRASSRPPRGAPLGTRSSPISAAAQADLGRASSRRGDLSKSDRPELDLGQARIIVSGGRSLGSARTSSRKLIAAARRHPRRGGRRLSRGRGCGLRPERLAGRPDRQGGRPRPLRGGAASPARSSTSPA